MRFILTFAFILPLTFSIFGQKNSSKYFSLSGNYFLENSEEKYDARNGDLLHHYFYKSTRDAVGVYIQVTSHANYTDKHLLLIESDAKASGQSNWKYIKFKTLKAFQLKASVGSNYAILTSAINGGRLFTITVVSADKQIAENIQSTLTQAFQFK